MKARFIHEAINFERGKDPFDTMDIGRAHLEKNMTPEQKYRAAFKRRGDPKTRTSHNLGKRHKWNNPKASLINHYTKGYKLWKALDLIKRSGDVGLTRGEIVKYMYEMVYGKGKYDSKKNYHRAWGNATYFHFFDQGGKNKGGAITHRTSRTEDRKYIINQKGLDFLNSHPEFDDGILYESVNFERGQDPLDAMKIGNVHKRKAESKRPEMEMEMKKVSKYFKKHAIDFQYNFDEKQMLYHIQ